MFKLVSKYKPSGDQPQAIEKLVDKIKMIMSKKLPIPKKSLKKL